jgi:hypothetical protein
MKDRSDVAFLITAFDQIREVRFTVDMLRTKWASTKTSPIVVVISGDTRRDLIFNDDPYTRVVHLDDMVGDKFKVLVSTSIAKQIEHGMIEVRDLERAHGTINSVVHMHGDILLLGEEGFFRTLDDWRATDLPVAADNVSPNGPHDLELWGKKYSLSFHGQELMPQLFAVDHAFCKATSYMYSMPVMGDLEVKATEWMLIGNLHRTTVNHRYLVMPPNYWKDPIGPYYSTYTGNVYTVKKGRGQWGLHSHWGGFAHFGNSLHYSKEHREARNKAALEQYNLDLEAW